MEKNSKIYVAGHKGLVGSAIVRNLTVKGFNNLILKTHAELELTNQLQVETFFETEKPEYVILAAAKVGGIGANSTYSADFIMQNELIQCNVIGASHRNKVKKLVFLGSSCIYPRLCPQPIKEEYLLSGFLEPTNEAYAIAKISGLKMCQFYNQQYGTNFISVMPTNLYGPNDNFDLYSSHVMPALIRKLHEAKIQNKEFVEVWGDGTALRDFLYVDDMAEACVHLIENYEGNEFFNVATGTEVSIAELVNIIKAIIGYEGEIRFDNTKSNGTPRKQLEVSKIQQKGWRYKVELSQGIKMTYKWFLKNFSLD